jgi:glycosyltransferase involved in cell wall biosynthesis
MAELARQMLVETYGIEPAKVRVIPHGVPPTEARGRRRLKDKLGLRGRTIISTFGLLDPRKGLEYMIRAMERLIERHPSALYLVVGKTHPDLVRRDGEAYRNELCELIEQRGLDKYVAFVDEYLTQRQIVEYLLASDVYVTPYLDPYQITSGTLAYALGAGKAIVSTRYLHATEALSDGRGVLVDFRSQRDLADAVLRILDEPAFKQELEQNAYAYGHEMAWPRVGERMLELFRDSADLLPLSVDSRPMGRIALDQVPPRGVQAHLAPTSGDHQAPAELSTSAGWVGATAGTDARESSATTRPRNIRSTDEPSTLPGGRGAP